MIKVKITGSKKEYILEVSNKKDDFMWDVALTEDELLEIYQQIKKKFKLYDTKETKKRISPHQSGKRN